MACSKTKNKYGHDLGPFSTNQKIALPGCFRELAGFEAKNFKLCPRGLHLCALPNLINNDFFNKPLEMQKVFDLFLYVRFFLFFLNDQEHVSDVKSQIGVSVSYDTVLTDASFTY